MSDAEIFVSVFSAFLAAVIWGRFGFRIVAVRRAIATRGGGWAFLLSIAAVFGINLAILETLASADVRNAPEYLAMYSLMGLAISALNLVGLRVLGLQEADLSQRGNRAAGILVVCMSIASALAFAGANIGDGPGFEVVVFCAVLSGGILWAGLSLHVLISRTMYRVLVGRDSGLAVRFGAMLIAIGLVAGRSVAGTWTGYDAAFTDCAQHGLPALLLVGVDLAVDWAVSERAPGGPTLVDAMFSFAYLAGAIVYVVFLGMPK